MDVTRGTPWRERFDVGDGAVERVPQWGDVGASGRTQLVVRTVYAVRVD
jgi:hypothetical protein